MWQLLCCRSSCSADSCPMAVGTSQQGRRALCNCNSHWFQVEKGVIHTNTDTVAAQAVCSYGEVPQHCAWLTDLQCACVMNCALCLVDEDWQYCAWLMNCACSVNCALCRFNEPDSIVPGQWITRCACLIPCALRLVDDPTLCLIMNFALYLSNKLCIVPGRWICTHKPAGWSHEENWLSGVSTLVVSLTHVMSHLT